MVQIKPEFPVYGYQPGVGSTFLSATSAVAGKLSVLTPQEAAFFNALFPDSVDQWKQKRFKELTQELSQYKNSTQNDLALVREKTDPKIFDKIKEACDLYYQLKNEFIERLNGLDNNANDNLKVGNPSTVNLAKADFLKYLQVDCNKDQWAYTKLVEGLKGSNFKLADLESYFQTYSKQINVSDAAYYTPALQSDLISSLEVSSGRVDPRS